MDLKIGTILKLPVEGTEFYNGKEVYIVMHRGITYRVKKYPAQARTKRYLSCICTGESYLGRPIFEQAYAEILSDLYEAGKVYQFKLASECDDNNTGAPYYSLEDEHGLRHRLYTPRNPLLKVGDKVKVKVLAINQGFLSLELQPLDPPKPSSYSLGDLIDLKQVVEPKVLDFSKLNPGKDTTLRDYQIDNKRKIYEAWQRCRSVMLQMPTGTGKTRLFVSIARDIFDYGASMKKAFKVLILAHRKELIEQISDHLGSKYRLAHGLIISQSIEQKKYSMQVGSVPTLNRRLERWEDKNFDVIIIDEAHHVKAKSYKKIIDMFPNAKILGVTATPYRLNHAGFRPEFDELIVSPSVAEFIKSGYLCEYDYYSIPPNSELQKEIDRMKLDFEGDYKESEMMDVMDRDFIRADILDTYQRYAGGKKAIIYTISRQHNVHLAEKFKEAGIVSAAIDSETPKEKRDEFVGQFRRGKIQVLFNVNIFSEGFDCPDVEVIQLARPTKSLSMYLQQVGRGLRPAEGKERLLILDNVGLYNKFGFPSARRKWKYHFEGQDVDESPAAHRMDRDEEREVKDIFEGKEAVQMLHTSTEEDVSTAALDAIVRDYKDAFIAFASSSIDPHTIQGYVRNIENALNQYIRQYVNTDFKSLFYTVNLEELDNIRKTLFLNADFVQINDEKHHVYSAALRKYMAFAKWFKEHQNDAPALPEIAQSEDAPVPIVDYREKFKAFLRQDKYSNYAIDQIINVLSTSVDHYIKTLANPDHTTVFETSDVEELTKYNNILLRDLNFASFNKMKGSRPGAALKKYIEFAKTLESVEETSVQPQPPVEIPVAPAPKEQPVDYYRFKEEFEQFLASKGINRPSIRRYATTLKDDVDPLANQLIGDDFKSIYYYEDLDIVKTMYELLVEEGAFKKLNLSKYNAPDVAIRKYIEFLQEWHPEQVAESAPVPEPQEEKKTDTQEPVQEQPTTSTATAGGVTIEEIDATLRELDSLVTLLKKNNLPVNPEVELKQKRLRIQKASIVQTGAISKAINDNLVEYKLDGAITFKYTSAYRDVEVYDPTFGPELQREAEEIEQIVNLMTKNNITVPQDVKNRQLALSRQTELRGRVRNFENWLVGYLTYLKLTDIELEYVYYSPRTGVMITFKNEETQITAPAPADENKPFVLEKDPIPETKKKGFIRVTFEDGSVLENENASETIVQFVEHIGIEKVKDLGIKMYYRPWIDSTPHPRYKGQCKQLSNGEYIMVLIPSERKIQLMNSIAKHFGLNIMAEYIVKSR